MSERYPDLDYFPPHPADDAGVHEDQADDGPYYVDGRGVSAESHAEWAAEGTATAGGYDPWLDEEWREP